MTNIASSPVIFVSGTGTGIGKTVISAILAEALEADYWKPVQAGFDDGTDSEWVKSRITNANTIVHPEIYRLKIPASPHIAARKEKVRIDTDRIVQSVPQTKNRLVIEGAGGLMVPLNEEEFVADLIVKLNVSVVLVSRNVLGSINHSLLTAMACREKNINVIGWIFNDDYLDYQQEIVTWSGIPAIASIPFGRDPGKQFVTEQARNLRNQLTW